MSMVIGTNVASLTAQRHLASSRADLEQSMERLSSGKRINSSMDDAAGLAIRDRMTSQVNGLNQAVRNAGDAISLGQSAEGALEESTSILQRMRELAVQSVNGTNSTDDRTALQSEVSQLQLELTRIATSTKFNGKALLDGSFTSQSFQIGQLGGDTTSLGILDMKASALGGVTAGTIVAAAITQTDGEAAVKALVSSELTTGAKKGDVLSFTIGADTFSHTFTADATIDAAATAFAAANDSAATAKGWVLTNESTGTVTFTKTAVGVLDVSGSSVTATKATAQDAVGSVSVSTASGSTSAIKSIDSAIKEVGQERAKLGAFQNRLEHTVSNLQSMVENTSAAQSRIEDADFATESANLAKNQVLQQAGTAMLSQANASTQNVLSLLK